MKKIIALAAVAAALLPGRVSAQDVTDPRYFAVDENSITIEEITDNSAVLTPPLLSPALAPADSGRPDITGAIGALDAIVNLVDKIWTIIEKNQPVVSITTNYANAVPYGTTHWSQLQGWSKPETKKYSFSMKNGFGSEVVKVTYQVQYVHDGNYQGKGKFLTGVTVEPLNVTTSWGYKVTLVSEVPDSTVTNVGTQADPVAAMQVQLKWTVHTALKDISSKAIYYVRGDGVLEEIGSPFNKAMELRTRARLDAASAQINNAEFN